MGTSLYVILVGLVHDPGVLSVLVIPLILIPLDVITGIARAVKAQQFAMRRLTDFVGNDLLKYLGIFLFIVFTWISTGEMAATALASTFGMGILSVSIGASIIENLTKLGAPPDIQQAATAMIGELEKLAAQQKAARPPTAQAVSSPLEEADDIHISQVSTQSVPAITPDHMTASSSELFSLEALDQVARHLDGPTAPIPIVPRSTTRQFAPLTLYGRDVRGTGVL